MRVFRGRFEALFDDVLQKSDKMTENTENDVDPGRLERKF